MKKQKVIILARLAEDSDDASKSFVLINR